MNFLRTTSTRRLLTSIFAIVAAGVATTAIAIAAVGSGPVAPAASLADAIHGALTGSDVTGVSADITFTNNLFSGASIDSTDPLLTGGSGRLWATSGHLRIELQTTNGDAEIVVNGNSFWVYDPSSQTVYEGTLPAQSSTTEQQAPDTSTSGTYTPPTSAQIQAQLDKLAKHVNVSTATATDIGGQPAYSVTLSPNTSAGLLGGVRLGFDAGHAVPLDIAVIPRGDTSPALELGATSVSYGAVPLSDFQISPPSGAKVVHVSIPTQTAAGSGSSNAAQASVDHQVVGSGLGAVLVLKHTAATAHTGSGSAGSIPLQTVDIGGASGQQLSTSLGTILTFTRAGTQYLLAGSVTAATLDSVARGL